MVWGHAEPRVQKTHVADDITMTAPPMTRADFAVSSQKSRDEGGRRGAKV
jgi:hypothetical protein